MNPENLVAGCERSLQFPPYTSLAGGKPPGLDITDASNRHTYPVQDNSRTVKGFLDHSPADVRDQHFLWKVSTPIYLYQVSSDRISLLAQEWYPPHGVYGPLPLHGA